MSTILYKAMRTAAFSLTVCLGVSAQDKTIELLQEVSNAPGPSGFEEPIRKIMVERMKPLAAALTFDGLGSIIATQGTGGPKIMLDAHMDELGGIVRRITPNGFLSMQMLGGWFDQALVDQRWVIIGSKGPVSAVTGIRDIHVAPTEERTRVFGRDTLFLDVGARSEEEARALGLEAGDPVSPDATFLVLNGGDNYLGKAWDDRAGCAVLIQAMERLQKVQHSNQIAYAVTTQEELGLRGAHTAADVLKPDLAITLEAGVTGDAPTARPEEAQEKLGGGPGIFLFDTSELPNRRLVQFVKSTAAQKNIPLQLDLVAGYGDDSAELQKSNGGVPTINIVIPTRYTHAHNGIINRKDFDRTVNLVVFLLQSLDKTAVDDIRSFAP